jgi:hypothetical protein
VVQDVWHPSHNICAHSARMQTVDCHTCEPNRIRIVFSVMLRRAALVRTDVTEELSASFIRVTRIGD